MPDTPLDRKAAELRLVELGVQLGILDPAVARECLKRQEDLARKGIDHGLETILASHPSVGTGRLEELQRAIGREPTCVLPDPPVSAETMGALLSRGSERGLPRAGDVFGAYTIRREIGRGGMGIVYEAWQESLKRRVALKLLHAHLVGDADSVKRFRREAESAARLAHPNIVHVYEFGEAAGFCFYAMEYLDGCTLEQLRERQPMVPKRAAGYVLDAARALDHAHHMGIIHRDIKPANLFVTREDKLYITDFGLARPESGTGLTATGAVMGTPAYMSPEQALGLRAQIDRRSDVYSLCMTLYALLAGDPPFSGEQLHDVLRQVVNDEPERPSSRCSAVPRDLEAITLKGISKAPERRYASALELAADLSRFLAGEPVEARAPGPFSGRAGRRRLAALGGVLLGGAVAAFAFRSGGPPAASGNLDPAPADPAGAANTPLPPGVDPGELERERAERIRLQAHNLDLEAKLFAQNGELERALERLARAEELDPDNETRRRSRAVVLHNLGVERQGAGNPQGAAEAFAQSAEAAPDLVPAWIGHGRALALLGDVAGSEASFERALALEPACLDAHVGLARSYVRNGNPGAARAELDQAVRAAPDSDGAHAARVGLLLDLGDLAAARAATEEGLGACPEGPELLIARARLSLREGNAEGAAADLEWVLQRQPRRWDLLAMRAQALVRLHRFDEAGEALEQAGRQPGAERGNVEVVRLEILCERKDWAALIEGAGRVLEEHPGLDPALRDHVSSLRGLGELESGHPEDAVATLRALVQRGGPGAEGARWNLAQALIAIRDLSGALAELRALATQRPDDVALRDKIAELERASGS